MVLKVYNTLTRKKEKFVPLKGKKVNIFVCGITPYDSPHIGHAKTYVQFDFIVKYLMFNKYNVFYLQNITDIDDRIIEKANSEKASWKEISNKYSAEFLSMMKCLNVNSVTKYAKATDHIPEIVSQVTRLLEKGRAYKIDDGYYFDLKKFPDYGKLSGRTVLEAEDSISRIDESVSKKNRGDFCLWKFSGGNKPSWPSAIGNGRPGWHIEDTSITEKYFGSQYDMHGGAIDLVFPHHEAEIAQMESISGKKPFVKYWLHTGFLNVKGTKMSKSLKNFITIKEALDKYDYKVLRYFYLSKHYRSPIDFSYELLEQSKNSLGRLNEFAMNSKGKKSGLRKSLIAKTKRGFYNALNDDFDTPKAFSILFDFVRGSNKIGPNNECYLFFKEIDNFFNIFSLDEEKAPKKIIRLANERLKARENKDFSSADMLRLEINKLGYIVEDSESGFRLKKRD